jgi:hypothetical protein
MATDLFLAGLRAGRHVDHTLEEGVRGWITPSSTGLGPWRAWQDSASPRSWFASEVTPTSTPMFFRGVGVGSGRRLARIFRASVGRAYPGFRRVVRADSGVWV